MTSQNTTQRRVLYYPHFEPDAAWLRSALLLFDGVTTIVPESAGYRSSWPVAELQDAIANSFETVAPTESDKYNVDIDTWQLNRAVKAMDRPGQWNSTEVTISKYEDHGKLLECFPDYDFLFRDKMSEAFYRRLVRLGMVFGADKVKGLKKGEQTKVVVDRRVADLFMSSLAGTVSSRLGTPAVTDEFNYFAINALKDVGSTPQPDRTPTDLLFATIHAIVPGNIDQIDISHYKEIHSAYADIRFPFFNFIDQLDRYHSLATVKDPNLYNTKINDLAKQFAAEVDKIRNSAVKKGLWHWAKFSFFSILKIGASLLHLDGVGETVEAIQDARREVHQLKVPMEQPGANLKVRMASLQHHLLEAAAVSRYIDLSEN